MWKNLVNHFKPHQKIASLGSGGGLWEVMLSFELYRAEIHLQDINPELLNQIELNNTITYFEKQFDRTSNCNFKITIGNAKETNLPSNYFDKVLLINSFHEFEYQDAMIAECQRILKPKGQIIIEEQLANYSGELHEGCGKRLFLEAELMDKFNGFDIFEKVIEDSKVMIVFIKSYNCKK